MPISHVRQGSVIMTEMSGVITFDEICAHLDGLVAAAVDTPRFIEHIDLRGATSIAISGQEAAAIGQIVVNLHRRFAKSHIVVIAPSAACFGVSRMLEAFVSMKNPTVSWHVLRDKEEAAILLASLSAGDVPPRP